MPLLKKKNPKCCLSYRSGISRIPLSCCKKSKWYRFCVITLHKWKDCLSYFHPLTQTELLLTCLPSFPYRSRCIVAHSYICQPFQLHKWKGCLLNFHPITQTEVPPLAFPPRPLPEIKVVSHICSPSPHTNGRAVSYLDAPLAFMSPLLLEKRCRTPLREAEKLMLA